MMKTKKFLVSVGLFFCIVLLKQVAPVTATTYPMKVVLTEKDAVQYDTPENAYISMISALISEDIDWYYDSLTDESVENEISLNKKYDTDKQLIFNSVKNIKEIFILDKKSYKNGVLLIVETINNDGSSLTGPSVFVQENGFWKSNQEIFSVDDPILDYLYYIPPLFYGKGQKPDDVNSFLGYEQPTQVQTKIATGTYSYTVHIYYGKTINPETFEAKLNKQDISLRFLPKPFTDQEVEIPLQQGRNVLILSIEGAKKDGKKAFDKDSLVFIAP